MSGGRSALVRAELSLLGNYGPHAYKRLDVTVYSYEYNRGKSSLTSLSMRV